MMNIPNRLTALAADISDALKREATNHSDWVEIKLDLCRTLVAAREEFRDHADFGKWLDDNVDAALGKDDRAAYIEMGGNLDRAREVLQKTQRKSIRLICTNEFRPPFRSAAKSPPRKPPEAEVRDEQIIADWDAGKSVSEAGKAAGLGDRRAARIIQDEKLRREGLEEGQLLAQPLSASAQEKLDAHKRRLEKEFEQRVYVAARKMHAEWYDESMKRWDKRLERMEHQLSFRQGVMKADEYKTLMLCCHPDTAGNASEAKRNEAMRILTEHKLRLVSAKEDPASTKHGLPRTREDFERAREEVRAANSARSKAAHAARKAQAST